jgi:hypothetical protein
MAPILPFPNASPISNPNSTAPPTVQPILTHSEPTHPTESTPIQGGQNEDDLNLPTESASFLETQPAGSKKSKTGLPSWRRTITVWLSVATVVFIINLVFLVYFYVRGTSDDLILPFSRTLYEGNCAASRSLNTGIHVLINLFSTLLVTASSYCMQVLSAPSRREVDSAHSQRRWLDIGILSFRNLSRVSKWRCFLWILLSISSVSLHLL